MATIKVPKTPAKAFNKYRPASDLLLRQIQHLEWARRPASARTAQMLMKPRTMTEGQAAERIQQLTAAVIEQGKEEAARAMNPGVLPVEPPAVPASAAPPAAPARYTRPRARARRRSTGSRKRSATSRAKKPARGRRTAARRNAAAKTARSKKR